MFVFSVKVELFKDIGFYVEVKHQPFSIYVTLLQVSLWLSEQ